MMFEKAEMLFDKKNLKQGAGIVKDFKLDNFLQGPSFTCKQEIFKIFKTKWLMANS